MEKRHLFNYAARLLIPVILFAPSFAFAAKDSGVDYGYGASAKGMAGAEAAYPQDSLVAAINPAGTAFVEDRFDASPTFVLIPHGLYATPPTASRVGLAFPSGNIKSEDNVRLQPSFGITRKLPDGKSTLGFAFYTSGSSSEYSTAYHSTATLPPPPGFRNVSLSGLYGSGTVAQDLKQFFGNLSFSRKITEHSSWGLSAILAAETLNVRGLSRLANINVAGTNTHFTNNGTDISYGIGVRGGVMTEILPTVSIGASYQPKISMSRMAKYENLLPEQGNLDIPANGVIGMSWKITPANILAIDTTKTWYSTVPVYSNTNYGLSSCRSGSNRSYCLGGSNGMGLGFNNPVTYKVGYEYHSSPTWIWRLGFGHGTPTMQDGKNIILALSAPVVQDYYTAGFTKKLNKKMDISMSAMYGPSQQAWGYNPNAPGQIIKVKSKMYEAGVTISRYI